MRACPHRWRTAGARDDVAALTEHRDELVALLKERYGDDFKGAHLAKFDDGTIAEIVMWSSREVAERAAKEVPGDPRAAGLFSRVGTVHDFRQAEVLHTAWR